LTSEVKKRLRYPTYGLTLEPTAFE